MANKIILDKTGNGRIGVYDGVHYSVIGAKLVVKQYFLSTFKYLHTSKFVFPETSV